jgi:hypothetical protein
MDNGCQVIANCIKIRAKIRSYHFGCWSQDSKKTHHHPGHFKEIEQFFTFAK